MYHFISLIFIFQTHIHSDRELQEIILLLGNKQQPQTSLINIQNSIHTRHRCSPVASVLMMMFSRLELWAASWLVLCLCIPHAGGVRWADLSYLCVGGANVPQDLPSNICLPIFHLCVWNDTSPSLPWLVKGRLFLKKGDWVSWPLTHCRTLLRPLNLNSSDLLCVAVRWWDKCT